jgi:hypothetical protein
MGANWIGPIDHPANDIGAIAVRQRSVQGNARRLPDAEND